MRKLVEIVLGPLPPTLLILPLVAGGVVGNIIALFAIAGDPSFGNGDQANALGGVFWQIVSGLCVMAGLFALWLVVLVDARTRASNRVTLAATVAALGLGAFQAARWLHIVLSHDPGYPLTTKLLWIFAAAGPVIVAAGSVPRLVRALRQRDIFAQSGVS